MGEVIRSLDMAVARQRSTGDTVAHDDWIRTLLVEYYDPMYQYQLQNTDKDLVFTGNAEEIRQFLNCL